jgi:hypothetical protein
MEEHKFTAAKSNVFSCNVMKYRYFTSCVCNFNSTFSKLFRFSGFCTSMGNSKDANVDRYEKCAECREKILYV